MSIVKQLNQLETELEMMYLMKQNVDERSISRIYQEQKDFVKDLENEIELQIITKLLNMNYEVQVICRIMNKETDDEYYKFVQDLKEQMN